MKWYRRNPATASVAINYEIAVRSNVRLFVVDVLGRQVADLASGVLEPGEFQARLDVRGFASGTYYTVIMTSAGLHVEALNVVR